MHLDPLAGVRSVSYSRQALAHLWTLAQNLRAPVLVSTGDQGDVDVVLFTGFEVHILNLFTVMYVSRSDVVLATD
jgi:hypothetical protein